MHQGLSRFCDEKLGKKTLALALLGREFFVPERAAGQPAIEK
jgi:hypothetical protein